MKYFTPPFVIPMAIFVAVMVMFVFHLRA